MNQQKKSFVARGARKPGIRTWISRITATALSAGLALTGLTVAAPSASALSTGCTSFNNYGNQTNNTVIYWQEITGGFVFETGETVTVTFSNPDTAGTVHIYAGTSAAPGQPAVFESKTSSSTFPATLSFTMDQDYSFLQIGDDTGTVQTDMSDLTCEAPEPEITVAPDLIETCGLACLSIGPAPALEISTPFLSQTITLTPTSDQDLADSSVEVTATSSSGLEVTIASGPTSVCTVSGTTITFVAAGDCTITADQAGDSSYLPAETVLDLFTITEASTAPSVLVTPNPPAAPNPARQPDTTPTVSTPTPAPTEPGTQPDTTPPPEQPLQVKTAASYFQKGNAKFHNLGDDKLNQLLATNPETITIIAVSNTRATYKANKRVANKRANAIKARAAQQAPNATITTEACAAKRKGGQMPREDRVVRSQTGKPLTTITVTYK